MLTSQVFGVPLPHTQEITEQEDIAIADESSVSSQADNLPDQTCDTTILSDETDQDQPLSVILATAGKLYDDVMAGVIPVESLQDSDILQAISQKLATQRCITC